MRSKEERIDRMHKRVQEMKKRHEKTVLAVMGTLSAFLGIILIAASVYTIGGSGVITDTAMAGSSMLAESAGGYVLVALISFTVAVLITAFCLRSRMRKEGKLHENAEKDASNGGI